MKFNQEKKQSIIAYILEKIDRKEPDVSKTVAETFDLSRNTVNQYLKELQEKGIIVKMKRNEYAMVCNSFSYILKRDQNELISDTHFFDHVFIQHIKDVTDEATHIWSYGFSEMFNNVIDHSRAETLYIRVDKTYLSTRVSLIDDGVGIFEKIKEHFGFSDLDEARCELFKGKLTTDKERHSGEGIFFTSKMMDNFLIYSSGKVFSTDKYEIDLEYDVKLDMATGTCVMMSLSNFTHRKIRDVFDQYSSDDGEFIKTKIPMRSIFDSAPVSRSQAKRLCYRLNEFEEAIIDFAGVAWMGQGFGHQLFVVFQNQHPDMKLTPIHMNDDVQMMYNHVTKTKY